MRAGKEKVLQKRKPEGASLQSLGCLHLNFFYTKEKLLFIYLSYHFIRFLLTALGQIPNRYTFIKVRLTWLLQKRKDLC